MAKNVNRVLRYAAYRSGTRRMMLDLQRQLRRRSTIGPAFAAFVDHLRNDAAIDPDALAKLAEAWGNPYSADVSYLEAVVRHARAAKKPILECGSGLTTLVLAAATPPGFPVFSLENDQRWHGRVTRVLRDGGHTPTVLHAPLTDYSYGRWYRVPSELPEAFGLVVCDGPPGDEASRGALLPVLRDRLSGAIVLVDDTDRPVESSFLSAWREDFDVEVETQSDVGRPFAVVKVPET